MIRFTIPGEPVGKGRPRFVRATGRTFTPPATRSYEGAVKMIAAQAMTGKAPLEGPLAVEITAYFAKPVSWSRKRAEATKRHIGRPDGDNIAKALTDACNGIVYRDDCQIALLTVAKLYSDDGSSGVVVTIQSLGE